MLEGLDPERRFDLIVVDAFTSDAVPAHLLTLEAVRSYVDRLAPGGMVALHLSNRHLRLEAVPVRIAAEMRIPALIRSDVRPEEDFSRGILSSRWGVITPDNQAADALAALRPIDGWTFALPEPGAPLWTDDFSNILGIFGLKPAGPASGDAAFD